MRKEGLTVLLKLTNCKEKYEWTNADVIRIEIIK